MPLPDDSTEDCAVEGAVFVRGQQKCGHPPSGQSATPMTGLDQQVHVTPQEAFFHVYVLAAVREQEVRTLT